MNEWAQTGSACVKQNWRIYTADTKLVPSGCLYASGKRVSGMKICNATQNNKLFEVEAKSQEIKTLEHMIAEFDQMAGELERQIVVEEERTGIRDTAHFAYSTFARSATQRQANLRSSIADLRSKLEATIIERDGILAEIQQGDTTGQRDGYRAAY